MTTYAVIRKSDLREVYRYIHTAALNLRGFEFVTHDHIVVPDPAPEVPPVLDRWITKADFRDLFTANEKIDLEVAAMDNPAATVTARKNAARVRVFLADVRDATVRPDGTAINLESVKIKTAVNGMETLGFIAAGRAAEILGGA